MARVQLDEDRDVESRYALGRIHSIESMGTVDGPGVRFAVSYTHLTLPTTPYV